MPTAERMTDRPPVRLSGAGAAARRCGLGAAGFTLVLCCLAWAAGWRPAETRARAHASNLTFQPRRTPAVETGIKWSTKCEDTCPTAKNGVCDEGRPASSTTSEVLCDLGTDCSDCGEHKGMAMKETWQEGGPIAYLTNSMGVKLYTRQTVTQPPFQMLFTDPTMDLDVSAYIAHNGIIEAGITQIFQMILQDQCIDPRTGKRRLVLDVGANFGYFSVYAALMGCRVIAWEPVPHFRAVLAYNLAINNVTHLVTVRHHSVSDVDGQEMTMQAPRKGIWGTASVKGINQQKRNQESTETIVAGERIDTVVNTDVLLMKADVEGYEPIVMRSAAKLFQEAMVENIVFEYSPGVAERTPYTVPQYSHLITDHPEMLSAMLNNGYRIGLMNDLIAKGRASGYDLPPLPEITAAQINYDIQDAIAYRAMHEAIVAQAANVPQLLNCPPKPELVALNDQWVTCSRMPEDAHPKSVRSSFNYNANLWATRNSKHIKLIPVTPAVMNMGDDARSRWSTQTDAGSGARSCNHIPIDTLVRNRCPCSFASKRAGVSQEEVSQCEAEQAAVDRLMAQGSMTFRDNEHGW